MLLCRIIVNFSLTKAYSKGCIEYRCQTWKNIFKHFSVVSQPQPIKKSDFWGHLSKSPHQKVLSINNGHSGFQIHVFRFLNDNTAMLPEVLGGTGRQCSYLKD